MKIHFLTTRIVDATGGAKYDYNFFNILKSIYSNDVILYDDKTILRKAEKTSANLIAFNEMYKSLAMELYDCDILIMNSRLYTRFILANPSLLSKNYQNTKIIVIHHHNNYMSHSGIAGIIHKKLEMRLLNSATEIIIPNIYVVDLIKKELSNPNIVFLESSFEKNNNTISSLKNHNLLFVGNVQERKGIIYGLKAFNILHKRFPEYTYTIVGKYDEDDKYYQTLKKYVIQNDLMESVSFLGRVNDEDLDKAYTNADIFLFPSLLEGYGWVLIEAMGRGVPAVVFNNSAMPYTVKNMNNGIVVDNLDWKQMGEALVKLAENQEILRKLQKGALDTYNSVPSQDDLNNQTRAYLENLRNS